MIKIENLTKSYAGQDVNAAEDVSFCVHAGEIVGFVGPNGAGKSTTIKCLTGILPFDSGKITVCGKEIRTQAVEAKMNVAYVADENILYNGLTGYQYINMISDIFGVGKDERKERTEKYASMFDIADKLGDKISSAEGMGSRRTYDRTRPESEFRTEKTYARVRRRRQRRFVFLTRTRSRGKTLRQSGNHQQRAYRDGMHR